MKGQRRDQSRENPRLIPSLALVSLGNHAIFAFKILRMKQEEIMRIEMEMKEALQDEQLRNQETAKYHKISTMFVTLGHSVFLSRVERCQEGIGLHFLQEIRDMLQETEKTSNLMATKEKDTQDRGGNVIGYREHVIQAQVARHGIIVLTLWILCIRGHNPLFLIDPDCQFFVTNFEESRSMADLNCMVRISTLPCWCRKGLQRKIWRLKI